MRLLLLTSSTGGGHDLRANAFAAWVKKTIPHGEARLFRPLEASSSLNRFGVNLYNTIQRRLPGAHHLYWNFLEYAGLHRKASRLSGTAPYIALLKDYRPDLVISVHAHLNHGYLDLARDTLGRDHVRVGTYCGELSDGYGFSRHWVNPHADFFLAATGDCLRAALRLGMNPAKARQVGFMLRPESYAQAGDKLAFFGNELGLDPSRFTLLLATGAVGANNHRPLLAAMDKAGLDLQVIALCGRDESLLQQLNAWKPRHSNLRLKAIPYTPHMPQLLASVDALVARGGTGTTSEAILAGCPLIVNALGGIMPQEMITLRYLSRFGPAPLISRASQLPGLLQAWLNHPESHLKAREHMRKATPPGHPQQTLRDLSNL